MENKITLSDFTTDSITNESGDKFFDLVDVFLKEDKKITVNVSNLPPFSSSFLNSSIGALVEKYTIQKVTSLVKFTNASYFNSKAIVKYFNLKKQN